MPRSFDDNVCWGHSFASSTVALVAARRPVRQLVYLCAGVPDIGRSVFDQWRDDPDMLNPVYVKGLSEPDAQTRTTWVDLQLARAILCADCDEPTAKAALNRLRPQARYPYTVPFPFPDSPRSVVRPWFVEGTGSSAPEWSKRCSRQAYAAVVELPESLILSSLC